MRHILFMFLDGVGLGEADPQRNPLSQANLPNFRSLLNGHDLLASTPRISSDRATFVPTDACLGVAGLPQSATGQATIVTGRNVAQLIGKHWGPKPNAEVREIVLADNLFKQLVTRGLSARLANAYPQRYFDGINSGKRMYSAIPLAVTSAGIPLHTTDDLRSEHAFSAGFTGEAWRTQLQILDTPIYSPEEAGRRLVLAARDHALLFFEHWPTDLIGHRGTLDEAIALLETIDGVLGGILAEWQDGEGLVIFTSDHGNIEDMSTRRHTRNSVPTLIIGADHARLAESVRDLSHLAPLVLAYLNE